MSLRWRYFHLNTSMLSEMRGRDDHTPRDGCSSHLLLICITHSIQFSVGQRSAPLSKDAGVIIHPLIVAQNQL